jgi:hypothetical protein
MHDLKRYEDLKALGDGAKRIPQPPGGVRMGPMKQPGGLY